MADFSWQDAIRNTSPVDQFSRHDRFAVRPSSLSRALCFSPFFFFALIGEKDLWAGGPGNFLNTSYWSVDFIRIVSGTPAASTKS